MVVGPRGDAGMVAGLGGMATFDVNEISAAQIRSHSRNPVPKLRGWGPLREGTDTHSPAHSPPLDGGARGPPRCQRYEALCASLHRDKADR